jgi:hypothetical protein
MLPRTVVDTKLATPNELSNMYIDFASRLNYFGVKCVIIGHCFLHTSAIHDRKRLRITDHSLGNDAGYNPGNRKLHRRVVWALGGHTASFWDKPSGNSPSCTRYNPSSLPDNESRCLQKLKTVNIIWSRRHFLPSSSGILSLTSVPPVTVTWIPITNRPSSISARKIEYLPSAYITWPQPHPNCY